MKEWTGAQEDFICDHLGTDMSGLELGRLFMVNPAEIHQLYRARRGHLPAGGTVTAFHSPGGGRLWSGAGIRGATQADAYQPMDHEEFQRLYRPPGWVRP